MKNKEVTLVSRVAHNSYYSLKRLRKTVISSSELAQRLESLEYGNDLISLANPWSVTIVSAYEELGYVTWLP